MFTILKCGYHSQHPQSFAAHHPNGISCYKLILVNVPSRFRIHSELFTVPANTLFLIRPNTPCYYSGIQTDFINDWLRFTCTAPSFEAEFEPLMNRPLPLINPVQISQYLENIVWEFNYADEKHREENTSMLLKVLLNKLQQEVNVSLQPKAYYPYTLKLQQLRLSMQTNPTRNYTSEELSGSLKISCSYFQHIYKDLFGISFKNDLIQMRLNYARNLILNTDIKLSQIAFMSGYTNEIHFYRQFKAHMGMTPGAYRQLARP